MTPTSSDNAALSATLDDVVHGLGLAESEPPGEAESVAQRRRRRGAARPSALARVSLVRIDDVLRWTYQRPPRTVGPRRARRASGGPVGGDVVHAFGFREVPPNKIVAALEDLDNKLTPAKGLRRWQNGALVPVTAVEATPRMLLVIHGTFAKTDVLFDELVASAEGRAFLAAAAKQYKQVLAFDHPTLSISPILNALDLEQALGGYDGVVDIICHSRGGLVAAWWLRTGVRNVGNVVFVGSPLEGTSLASPAKLKRSLDVLANIADAANRTVTVAGSFVPQAAPLLAVAAGLMRVIGGVLSVGARTPLVDAGVAVVAGLAAQSRVQNNQELIRLHERAWPSKPTCFAIVSDFEPANADEPWWQFWKKLRSPALTLANAAADSIFDGPNDLVVDAASMARLVNTNLPVKRVYNYGTNSRVHHCNYFAQPETAVFLAKTLI